MRLCQDAKAHVLHVLHLMLHVHSSCYMTCYMRSLHDTCHVMTTLSTIVNCDQFDHIYVLTQKGYGYNPILVDHI